MKYNEFPKFQSGGMEEKEENTNAACMALQQAMPQLPEDLKAGAQQALQTGQCEQFIKMLQEQAQQGGHNAQIEQGMPMAKFGAYFGMPEDTMVYNMKIANLGLYAISNAYLAQKGLFKKKRKNKPIEDYEMTPEEKYQRWLKSDEESAEIMAGLKPFPKETFPKNQKVIVDSKNDVYIDGSFVGKYEDAYDPKTGKFVVEIDEKGKYTPRKKQQEQTNLTKEDYVERAKWENTPKNTFLSDLAKIAMTDIIDSQDVVPVMYDDTMERTEKIDSKERKPIDNADPVRGELSELMVKHGINADLDSMDKMQMLKMISDIKNAAAQKKENRENNTETPKKEALTVPEKKVAAEEQKKVLVVPEKKVTAEAQKNITNAPEKKADAKEEKTDEEKAVEEQIKAEQKKKAAQNTALLYYIKAVLNDVPENKKDAVANTAVTTYNHVYGMFDNTKDFTKNLEVAIQAAKKAYGVTPQNPGNKGNTTDNTAILYYIKAILNDVPENKKDAVANTALATYNNMYNREQPSNTENFVKRLDVAIQAAKKAFNIKQS